MPVLLRSKTRPMHGPRFAVPVSIHYIAADAVNSGSAARVMACPQQSLVLPGSPTCTTSRALPKPKHRNVDCRGLHVTDVQLAGTFVLALRSPVAPLCSGEQAQWQANLFRPCNTLQCIAFTPRARTLPRKPAP